MKKILPILVFGIMAASLPGQVEESVWGMKAGRANGFSITIPDAEDKFVLKHWVDYQRSKYGNKFKRQSKREYLAEGIVLPGNPTSGLMNMRIRAEDIGRSTRVTVWLSSAGTYVDSRKQPIAGDAATEMLLDFRAEVSREKIRIALAEEEKKLQKLEREMDRLAAAHQRHHRSIEIAEERIQKAKEDITLNEQSQEATAQLLEEQSEIVDAIQQRLLNIQ